MFMVHKSPQIILLMHPFNTIKHFLEQLIKAQHCRDTKKNKALPMISALIGCTFEVTLSMGLGSRVNRAWLTPHLSPAFYLLSAEPKFPAIQCLSLLSVLSGSGGQLY